METNDMVRKDVCEQKHYTIDDRFKNVHHRIDELRDLVTVVKQQGEAIIALTTELRESRRDIDEVKHDVEDLAKDMVKKEDFNEVTSTLNKMIERPGVIQRDIQIGIIVAIVSIFLTWFFAKI